MINSNKSVGNIHLGRSYHSKPVWLSSKEQESSNLADVEAPIHIVNIDSSLMKSWYTV